MIVSLNSDRFDIQELMRLINLFPLSTSFFDWFAGNEITIDVSFEKKSTEKFERLADHYIHGLRVFSGGGELFLNHMSKSFSECINEGQSQYYNLLPELSKLKKRHVGNALIDSQYTIISQFFYQDRLCGGCWEVYHMENLLKIYKTKKRVFPDKHKSFYAP